MPQLINADGSFVKGYGYDNRTLFVNIQGTVNAYTGKGTRKLFNGLKNADSKGTFFNQNIRHNKTLNRSVVSAVVVVP
jgi:hypothetical protein